MIPCCAQAAIYLKSWQARQLLFCASLLSMPVFRGTGTVVLVAKFQYRYRLGCPLITTATALDLVPVFNYGTVPVLYRYSCRILHVSTIPLWKKSSAEISALDFYSMLSAKMHVQ